MSISNILAHEMAKSNGTVRLVKVPQNMRPTAKSLKQLEKQIQAQLDENYAFRWRSMQKINR